MKKRILSVVLMLTMVFSVMMVPDAALAAEYYDTEGLDCELAVDVLGALGIMSGYTDGSFLPYNSITRAEMAAIAVKLAGVDEIPRLASEEDVQFNDMYGYDDWASGIISVARGIGIAKGDADGNFNPDMSATYEDALQMVVCALGYEPLAASRGGEAKDFVYVAHMLGLTKKLSTGMGQNITRADVAKLVYEALTVDLMQQVSFSSDGTLVKYNAVEGENALNTYFDTNEVKGIVYETEYSSIDGGSTVDEGEVLINGEAFDVGSTDIYNYLGYYVEAYALDADDAMENRTIIAFSVKSVKNNTLTIVDENIEDVSGSISGYTFSYWVNKDTDKRSRTARTIATPMVLYNGKAASNVTEELLKPEFGSVVLIDNNGDDKYDIIDVWEYDLVYVFTASKETSSVVGYYDRSTTYKFDTEDDDYHVTFLNSYGGAASFGDIKQYSVLYVYQSLDREEKKVIISNSKVTGDITEISGDDEYLINGIEYEISPAAAGRLDLSVMDSGDFYLDADNRIVGFEGSSTIKKRIGMFIAVNDGGLRRGYQMKVLTETNGVQIYNLASTVKVNDVKMTAADVYANAYADELFGKNEIDTRLGIAGVTRGDPSKTGFLYKLNSSDEISEMIIVGDETYNRLQRRQLGERGQVYYSASKKVLHYSAEQTTDEFNNTVGKRTYVDNSTLNFLSFEFAKNKNDNDNFWVKPMTSYSDNYKFETGDGPDFMYAYYYSDDGSPVDMQKTVCNFLVMTDWYDIDSDDSTVYDTDQNQDARYYQPDVAVKFIYKITQAYDKTYEEETYRVYYIDGTNLRNALIRPQYKHEAFLDQSEGILYPNGYPVRIGFDGSYIESIAGSFGTPYSESGKTLADMVQPIYNETTSSYVMKWLPFYLSYYRPWSSGGTSYETRMYLGMIMDLDEVVTQRVYTLATATTGTPTSTTAISIDSNERLEGNVYRMNYDNDGNLDSISKGTLDDLSPGQLVLVRKYAYDSGDNRWFSLSGYGVREFIILADSVEELDYLSNFYKFANAKYNEVVNKKN